jgi:hypothetical protein
LPSATALSRSRELRHPFQRWPRRRRRLALACVAVAALIPTVGGLIVKPLHEDETGDGIVEFELAGSVDRADEILATWRVEGVVDNAKRIQTFDLIYPLIYAAALAGGCIAVAGAWRRAGRARGEAVGIGMAWVAFAAAGFDYVENLGLGISLWDAPASPWPQLAFAAAVLKFACIWASLLYVLSGAIAWVLSRRGQRAASAKAA